MEEKNPNKTNNKLFRISSFLLCLSQKKHGKFLQFLQLSIDSTFNITLILIHAL